MKTTRRYEFVRFNTKYRRLFSTWVIMKIVKVYDQYFALIFFASYTIKNKLLTFDYASNF